MRDPKLRGRGPHLPPLDQVVQYDVEPGYVVFTLPVPKRLRVVVGDETVADTTRALMLHESDHLPVYYFPLSDIRQDLLVPSGHRTECPFKGTAHYASIRVGDRVLENAFWHYPEPITQCPDISQYGSFYWNRVDHWYEEDEEVFVHARDPYRRLDCLHSRRRVQVVVGGEIVADATDNVFLFETGLPTRYYLPRSAVSRELLRLSPYETRCPYKGRAEYYHLDLGGRTHENLIWFYANPCREVLPIIDRLCFYNERVDEILVDGEPLARPQSRYAGDGGVRP